MEKFDLKFKEGGIDNNKLMAFGVLFKSQREVNGFSIAETARRFNVTQSTINSWEKGQYLPGEDVSLLEISKLFDIELDFITDAFNMSKTEREKEKNGHKREKPKFKVDIEKNYPGNGTGHRVSSHFTND